jgi:hypothetical protein
MLPTPVCLEDRIRIYFTSLGKDGRGRPGFVEVDAHDPTRIVRGPVGPVLELGLPGDFDQDGVVASSIVRETSRWLLYYVGFERGTQIKSRILTGVAVSSDQGESFQRVRSTPALERSDDERVLRGSPFVSPHERGYQMWYAAGSGFTQVAGNDVPVCDLRYIESRDGIEWPAVGDICLAPVGADEHCLARAWVVRDVDRSRMFLCVRLRSTAGYRLGYAESPDGIQWTRLDTMGLDVSATGWDSQAIMYPAVVDVHERRYCFYNGNDFGRDGIGVAVLEAD